MKGLIVMSELTLVEEMVRLSNLKDFKQLCKGFLAFFDRLKVSIYSDFSLIEIKNSGVILSNIAKLDRQQKIDVDFEQLSGLVSHLVVVAKKNKTNGNLIFLSYPHEITKLIYEQLLPNHQALYLGTYLFSESSYVDYFEQHKKKPILNLDKQEGMTLLHEFKHDWNKKLESMMSNIKTEWERESSDPWKMKQYGLPVSDVVVEDKDEPPPDQPQNGEGDIINNVTESKQVLEVEKPLVEKKKAAKSSISLMLKNLEKNKVLENHVESSSVDMSLDNSQLISELDGDITTPTDDKLAEDPIVVENKNENENNIEIEQESVSPKDLEKDMVTTDASDHYDSTDVIKQIKAQHKTGNTAGIENKDN
jgi:hypothetical protein